MEVLGPFLPLRRLHLRNAENDVRDNGEARDSDALMPENSASAPSQPAILFFSN
jgi:hypothetical protein